MGLWGRVTGAGCWGGVASLGISWLQRYSLLSGTNSLSHTESSRVAVRRSSSLSLEFAASASEGVSSKVSHWQTTSQNGRPLGCLEVKGESWLWAVV